MATKRLSLFTALFMTIAIAAIVLIFNYIQNTFADNGLVTDLLFLLSLVLIFIICFFGVDSLFHYYGKREVQRMAGKLPERIFDDDSNIGFKELSEKISGLNETNDMMKEMESYRKEYIGNVSHELKTPLFSIQGYVETLRDGAADNIPIRDKYLDRIGISVERLINIVNDLDMINRFEAGEISLSISKFDINALVREVFDLLEFEADKKNAQMALQHSQQHVLVNADKQKISQVIINLVSNAIYYANRPMAQITVRTTVLKNKVHIVVQDNGMGIKPEVLPRIFERFYRVESSRSRREGGSGLGLAIVKHILEAHGENISVESEYLEGTKFSFLLDKA